MARTCGHDHHPQVHTTWPPAGQIACVVLAAGRASRMGRPKATLPLRAPWGRPEGEPAAHRILRLCEAAGIGRRIVVLGHHQEVVRQVCAGVADFAVNKAPDRGMFSSVKVGLRVALEVPTPPEGVLVWPADCPLIRPAALRQFFAAGNPWLKGEGRLWARVPALKRDAHALGHPIMLSAALARRVLEAPDDGRLDHLIGAEEVDQHRVLLDDPHLAINLNTVVDARPYTTLTL